MGKLIKLRHKENIWSMDFHCKTPFITSVQSVQKHQQHLQTKKNKKQKTTRTTITLIIFTLINIIFIIINQIVLRNSNIFQDFKKRLISIELFRNHTI